MDVEVIGMIYKSVEFLDFMVNQITRHLPLSCRYRIIANDPSEEVLQALKDKDIPHSVYRDPLPNDYYLNRVYRAWNFGGATSEARYLCFVNSDMAFSKSWLSPLYVAFTRGFIGSSRLVESGKFPSGAHGIIADFGRMPGEFDQAAWDSFSAKTRLARIEPRGLYMPYVISSDLFRVSRGYPAGNLNDEINGFCKLSGDAFYFDNVLFQLYGRKHVTCLDSVVYHMQEGEKDAS